VKGRTLKVAGVAVIVLFVAFWLFVPTELDHSDRPIIRAQESSARSLASAEMDFYRRHGRYTAAMDSLPWRGFAGMVLAVEAADTMTFRARIISITDTTVEMALEVVDGAPRIGRIARTAFTPADQAVWEGQRPHTPSSTSSGP
jgi:hypothetical protein